MNITLFELIKFKNLYISALTIVCILINCVTLEAKWVNLGFEETWNNGLFYSNELYYGITIGNACFDSDKNPHMLTIIQNFNFYYTFWDGEKWGGLEGVEPTPLDFDEISFIIMEIDSKNYLHFVYSKNESKTVKSLNYIFWNGESWSDSVQIIKTDKEIDEYYLGDLKSFGLDKENNPHILFSMKNGTTKNMHIYYKYQNEGAWASLDDSDKGFGLFKNIEDYIYDLGILQFDSKGFPHLFVSSNIGDYGEEKLYTRNYIYWNGEEWQGIEGSDTQTGIRYAEVKEISRNFDFFIDSKDNVHFVYPAEIEGSIEIIYAKWDGENWYGLRDGESYTKIEIDFFIGQWWFSVNFNEVNTLNFLVETGILGRTEVKYNYWDKKSLSWKGLGGSNMEHGIVPSDVFKFSYAGLGFSGFEFDRYPSSIITGIYHGFPGNGKYFSFASVLKWEEEILPTIELYTDNFEHSMSAEDDAIKISGRVHNPFDSSVDVSIVAAMMTPAEEILYFPRWSEDYNDIALTLPTGFVLPWSELMNFDLPSESPPIDQAGTYYFGMFLINSDDGDFYSYDVKKFYVVD